MRVRVVCTLAMCYCLAGLEGGVLTGYMLGLLVPHNRRDRRLVARLAAAQN